LHLPHYQLFFQLSQLAFSGQPCSRSGYPYWINAVDGHSTWEPPLWIDLVDEESGCTYYINNLTGENQWYFD
jgi:hypothetical protein